MNNQPIALTMLNSMAGQDVETSFENQLKSGIRLLDLKDNLWGKSIEQLTIAEARRLKHLAEQRGLQIHTLSSSLFYREVEAGETGFKHDATVLQQLLEIADILQPVQIRLLMCASTQRSEILDASCYLSELYPWVSEFYRDAVKKIAVAGYKAVMENEAYNCLFASPREIVAFFQTLDCHEQVSLIWDIQNLWQMGTFPTLTVYHELRSFISMIHLKGWRSGIAGGKLQWQSQLAESSWPVSAILRAVIDDGRSPVLCLNPSHGQVPPGFHYTPWADIEWLRHNFKEIA